MEIFLGVLITLYLIGSFITFLILEKCIEEDNKKNNTNDCYYKKNKIYSLIILISIFWLIIILFLKIDRFFHKND